MNTSRAELNVFGIMRSLIAQAQYAGSMPPLKMGLALTAKPLIFFSTLAFIPASPGSYSCSNHTFDLGIASKRYARKYNCFNNNAMAEVYHISGQQL